MSNDREPQKEMRNRAVAEMMRRADEELLPTLSQKLKLKSPWDSYLPSSGERAFRLMEASKLWSEADAFFRKRNFKDAESKYIEGAKLLIGSSDVIPRKPGRLEGGVTNSTYNSLNPTERAALMSVCTGAGKCLWRELDYDGESIVIEENLRESFPTAMFDWKDYFVDYPPLSTEKFMAMIAMSDVLFELGNTAASLFYIWNAFLSSSSVPPSHVTPDFKGLLGSGKVRERAAMRHPDPKRTATIAVKDCRLQVKGSWQKLVIKKKNDLLMRLQFSSFVWEGHLYVLGGQKESGPQFRDMWSLDLEVLDEWRQEPSYPSPQSMTGYFEEWSVGVWEDKAYVINGREKVDYFDLKTKKWGYIITTYKPTTDDVKAGMDAWPWPGKILTCATMQVNKGKLYLFGGRHRHTRTLSGKTYLFGGLCNTDFIPSCRMSAARPFGDLWQLKLDAPGGYLEGVDMDEESKTARVGPWQRCFNCASAGPWKKCGGSCNGRAFFYGAECLKDGWRTHKETHKCRKK